MSRIAHARPWLLALLSVLLLIGTVFYFSAWVDDPEYWRALGIGVGVASLAVIGMLRVLGFPWNSAPVVYLAFVWMFHFPMVFFLAVFPGLWMRLNATAYSWTQSAMWSRASLYAFLCVTAFAIGCAIAGTARRRLAPACRMPSALRFQVGVVTALGGLAWLYYLLYREGGLDLFGNSYAQLYTSVFGADFSTAVFIVSVGAFLALMSAPSRMVWVPVCLQLAASAPVLLTGARQFALIGPLVLAVLAAKRGIRLGFLAAAISCCLMLWLIAYVGETRSHGVLEGVSAGGPVNPITALVEMGGSLETTSLAHDWIRNGDSYLLGGSYWLPFERGLGLVLPIRQDLATDTRAMNMLMVSRIAGLGGSAVAESYYNFSVFGALVFLALGILLTRLDLSPRPSISMDVLGIALYAFLFQARNWFISVPRMMLIGIIPLVLCLCAEALARRRDAAARAPGFDHSKLPGGVRV